MSEQWKTERSKTQNNGMILLLLWKDTIRPSETKQILVGNRFTTRSKTKATGATKSWPQSSRAQLSATGGNGRQCRDRAAKTASPILQSCDDDPTEEARFGRVLQPVAKASRHGQTHQCKHKQRNQVVAKHDQRSYTTRKVAYW